MQVLKVITARSIWLFPLLELNPRGKPIDVDLVEWLKKTYQFQKYPASVYDFDKDTKTLTFEGGKFKAGYERDGKERYAAIGLTIYTDGLVANAGSSTADSEKFLEEALRSAVETFGLVAPEKITKKLYFSELDVRLERPINLLNPKLEKLTGRISELRPEEPHIAFTFSGISYLPQPDVQARLSPFAIERKVYTDWSENKYYTRAPLNTEAHIKLIEEFETLLA